MKTILASILTAVVITSAQAQVTRERMQETKRVSKEELAAGYQTQIPGWVVHEGDSLQLNKGSMPDKRFAFIYESLTSFHYMAGSSNNAKDFYDKRYYLQSAMADRRVIVKELFQYGTKKTGYIMIAKVNASGVSNYWIEIDNAVEAGELLPPPSLRTAKASTPGSNTDNVTDQIKKLKELKELLDSGAVTQQEYDAMKKKLINQP